MTHALPLRVAANDDPGHSAPIGREEQIRLMLEAPYRRAEVAKSLQSTPALQAILDGYAKLAGKP